MNVNNTVDEKSTQVDNAQKLPTLAKIEEEYIKQVLLYVNGNKSAAAKILGVSLKTMYNKLNSYSAGVSNEEK